MNNLHTNIPENTILINRKIVFENEPASFENKRIEISDMLLLKKSSLSIKNCTVIFEGENAAIVGVESKSMVFENCVFSSKETFFDKNCKTKIVSHITEPKINTAAQFSLLHINMVHLSLLHHYLTKIIHLQAQFIQI